LEESLKKRLFIVFVLAFLIPSSFAKYSGGDGLPENPFQIATPNDLNDIGNHPSDWDKHFVMVNDINLAAYTGTMFQMIGYWEDWLESGNDPFTGVFDGNNHTISNFTYATNATSSAIGIFSYVRSSNAEIKNLIIKDPNVSNPGGTSVYDTIGSLIGRAMNGVKIENCSVVGGTIQGYYHTAGLIGLSDGSVIDCTANTRIIGETYTGGLVGENTINAIMKNCSGAGQVMGNEYTGGLIGYNYGKVVNSSSSAEVSGRSSTGCFIGINSGSEPWSYILNCYATGTVTGAFKDTGGFAGKNLGIIKNSYATGNVLGVTNTGGFAGKNLAVDKTTKILECYSTGNVTATGDSAGGLVGLNVADFGGLAVIETSFASGDVNNTTFFSGGLVGSNYTEYDLHKTNQVIIRNCYATGNVDGYRYNGGLLGRNRPLEEYGIARVEKSYSIGESSGYLQTGGFCGSNLGTINDSFWDTQASGNPTSAGGEGKITSEMKTKSTFTNAGWDFSEESANGNYDIWRMCIDDTNYPQLSWEFSRYGDFLCPDGTDFIDYSHLAGHWLFTDCADTNDCSSTDLDFSGTVDINDVNIFTSYWLFGK
jgi:hypothetical protein